VEAAAKPAAQPAATAVEAAEEAAGARTVFIVFLPSARLPTRERVGGGPFFEQAIKFT
jgi:hypothetical protein